MSARRSRLLARLLLVVAALSVIAAVWAFWPTPGALPSEADASGYRARIVRDEFGVPHVFGATDADTAFGLAYAHAEDDFATIQRSMLAVRGDLARVDGADAAPGDYLAGLLRVADVAAAGYRTLSPRTRALLDGYAAGLNAYALDHPDEVLAYLFPARGEDLVAASVFLTPFFFGLDGVVADLYGDERPELVHETEAAALPYGSNVLAVGPTRSGDGSTRLAVNSHQPWTGPFAWYEATVQSDEGWHMTGGLFPGSPVVIVGHNERVGWSFTVNKPDLIDVYLLDVDPDDPDRYRVDGEWLELERWTVPIEVRLFGRVEIVVEQEALWSIYGPVVRRPHGTYAIRWAGIGETGLWEQLYDMNRAEDLGGWLDAFARRDGLPMFNVGYADADGHIFYAYNALAPRRDPSFDWRGFVPGDTRATLWEGYHPFSVLPQVLDPAIGFIQNANSTPYRTTDTADDPDPDDTPATLGVERWMTNRAFRALTLLHEDEAIDAEDLHRIKYDMAYDERAAVDDLVRRLSRPRPDDDPDVARARRLLEGWDGEADPADRTMALVALTLVGLNDDPDVDLNPSRLTRLEPTDADLEAAFDGAVAHLLRFFGRLDPRWDAVNRLRVGDVDLGLGGGPDLLHAVYSLPDEDGRLRGVAGDAYLALVHWSSDGAVRSRSIHQFGAAVGRPDSPHHADQAPLFVRRELKPTWFDAAELPEHAERTVVVGR